MKQLHNDQYRFNPDRNGSFLFLAKTKTIVDSGNDICKKTLQLCSQKNQETVYLDLKRMNIPTERYSSQKPSAIQIPMSLRSSFWVMYNTGKKPVKVDKKRRLRRYFISPSPLKTPSSTKAIALNGCTRITIKNM